MAKRQKVVFPRRGEIWLVNFDSTVGAEIKKTRPALIVQNDIANRFSPITIVAALTSQFEEPLYPTEVLVRVSEGSLEVDSVVLLNQIRSTDKKRLIKRLGILKQETMGRIDRALQISLGLVKI
jgi:mRNA interferase MazF